MVHFEVTRVTMSFVVSSNPSGFENLPYTLICLGSKFYRWCGGITRTATAGSDLVQSGRSIFDDFFQHLWPYIGNNTTNVVFQMVKRLWLIRIDQ
ncbi:hypothetical protein TNCV_168411 [Trichonephila clavipes]|nr:hypothetical protein TNCV_168411 [Trichonephila clavipes]